MAKIFSYKKVVDTYTTHTIVGPDTKIGEQPNIIELCDLDGLTYVSVPDGVILPAQPKQIDVKEVVLTDELVKRIEAASPYIQLIKQRTVDAIRAKYSIEDELKALRCKDKDADGTKQFVDYDKHVEDCKTAISTAGKVAVGLAPKEAIIK